MTATPEQKAPGCFGAASVYSMDSEVCRTCVAFQECGEASLKRLEEIKQLVDVRDLLKRHAAARQTAMNKLRPPAPSLPILQSPVPVAQPTPPSKPIERKTAMVKITFDISDDDQSVIAMIGEKSIKAKEQAIVLCRSNKVNDMRSMLPRGMNPFAESGPQFLRIACDMLLNGGFTKANYKARLIADLSWTDGTAGSHVAIACALLYSFGITTLDSLNAFVLNPALSLDNNEMVRKVA